MSRLNVARGLLYAVAIGAVVILVQFVLEIHRSTQEQYDSDIRAQTAIFTQDVNTAVSRVITQVQSIGAFFESSNVIDEREFSRFVIRSRFLEGPVRARAIAVMPLLHRDELPKFRHGLSAREALRRQIGYEPFDIVEEQGRDVYAPVVYVESSEGRKDVLGYDLASSPVRLTAAMAALASFQPHMTPPLTLSQDSSADFPSVLVVGAVKSNGNMGLRFYLPDEADRSIFIAASITPAALIKGLLQKLPGERRFSIRIDDVTDAREKPVFETADKVLDHRIVANQVSVIGNRVWSFSFSSIATAAGTDILNRFTIFGVLGAALILALAIALDRLLRVRGMLEQQVRNRTEELHSVNRALAEAAEKANAESDAKSKFLARMSHDLRTPLNAVIGYAQMMTSEVFGKLGSPQYVEYAETIEKAGRIQLDLVEEVLTLTALQSGTQTFARQPVDLADIARQCVDILRLTAAEKGVSLSISSTLDGGEHFGDAPSVQQIILNLVSNALKFTGPGGSVVIHLVGLSDDGYEIAVSDTGVGISENDIQRVLMPFSKLDQNPYTSNEGVGLGLTIVKTLTEANGGTVEIESELGVGTTVRVIFPVSAPGDLD